MSDVCPDNSTACLLRSILDGQPAPSYDWDPINFGFTAGFTIIAFIVSVVALFQSFVAAGPGRLKASERAIGHSQHKNRTDTQFSWKEFRYRTIVNVPVIDIKKILQYAPAVVPIVSDEHKYEIKNEIKQRSVVKLKGRVVAGWSQLLYDLSLADISFNTIECLTDYLPDDVPAAPAWARMESILLLCIMKGCTLLVADEDGFISATGPSAQLSWNMHPTLGPMAVYRTWDVKNTSVQLLNDVQRMIPTCLGELYLADEKLFHPGRKRRTEVPISFHFDLLKAFILHGLDRCKHSHDHCENRRLGIQAGQIASENWEGEIDTQLAALAAALFADRPAKIKAFPTRLSLMNAAIKTIYDEHFPWLILADDLDDSVLEALCGPNFVEFDGSEAIAHPYLVDAIKLTSWVVPASQQNSSSSTASKPLSLDRPELYDPASVSAPSFGSIPTQVIQNEKFSSSCLRISRNAVRHLSRWLSDDTYFEMADLSTLSNARLWLGYQLAEIDWFLSSQGDDAICAAANLVALGSLRFGAVKLTKLSRRFVMPETLDAFNLSWTVDPSDEGSIIVQGYLDRETVQRLFSYTRTYVRTHRHDLHTVKCAKVPQGFYYATKKSQPSGSPKETRSSGTSGTDALLESAISNSSSISNHSAGTKSTDSVSTEKPVDYESKGMNVTTYEELGEVSNPSSANISSGRESSKTPALSIQMGDAALREFLQEGRRFSSAEDEVDIHIDERVAALEALTFFRGGVFAALLATGTDTSIILNSDKRHQLVQVQ